MESNEFLWIFVGRVNYQGLLNFYRIVVRPGSLPRVGQGKQVLLEPLVAETTGQKKIVPVISKPVIAGLLQWVLRCLSDTALRTKMFNITIGDVRDFGLAKGAFAVLARYQRFLKLPAAVYTTIKIEYLGSSLIRSGIRVECSAMSLPVRQATRR